MKVRLRDRIKLISDTVLFVSLMITAATGILKMPALADSLSDDLYRRFQSLPWGTLKVLHDWSGALAIACVVVHLSLVWRRYFWLLRNSRMRED